MGVWAYRRVGEGSRSGGGTWSAPRLRGRGKQGEKCEADPFASALYTATPTSASETMDGQFTRKSADRRKAWHTFVPAHHGLASEARSTGHSRAAKSSFFNHQS